MPGGVLPTGGSDFAPVLCDACLGRLLLPSAAVILLEHVFPARDLEFAPSTPRHSRVGCGKIRRLARREHFLD